MNTTSTVDRQTQAPFQRSKRANVKDQFKENS